MRHIAFNLLVEKKAFIEKQGGDYSGSRSRIQYPRVYHANVKINGELSTKSITEALGITGMAVRRHLESLKSEGYITYRTVKQPMEDPSPYTVLRNPPRIFP